MNWKSRPCFYAGTPAAEAPRTFHVKEKDLHSERLKLIFDYIHGHYAEEISVEDMARLCSITPSHFMHYFKEKAEPPSAVT